jgi:hypothetical protein
VQWVWLLATSATSREIKEVSKNERYRMDWHSSKNLDYWWQQADTTLWHKETVANLA